MRVFAVSDLHVDYKDNQQWVGQLSGHDYVRDVLILAGDVSDREDRMIETLNALRRKFERVFFVPGNHDLWVRPKESGDSLDKFLALMTLCEDLGVDTQVVALEGVRIVPLHSWYERDGANSLCMGKEGEDPQLRMWMDNRLIRWPEGQDAIAKYMLDQNTLVDEQDRQVITFSHFLPRRELILGSQNGVAKMRVSSRDPHPKFNFSRVAGTTELDRQVRQLGASLHIYGHQHRNRCREIDGVTYISHCLGYARERQWGLVCEMDEGPRLVWEGV